MYAAFRSSLLVAALLLLPVQAYLLPDTAQATYRVDHVVDKIIRLWFVEQNGVHVYNILVKMTPEELMQLNQRIEEHPFIQEMLVDGGDPWKIRAYQNLRRVINDAINRP